MPGGLLWDRIGEAIGDVLGEPLGVTYGDFTGEFSVELQGVDLSWLPLFFIQRTTWSGSETICSSSGDRISS